MDLQTDEVQGPRHFRAVPGHAAFERRRPQPKIQKTAQRLASDLTQPISKWQSHLQCFAIALWAAAVLIYPQNLYAQSCTKVVACLAGAALNATVGNFNTCNGESAQQVCNSIRTASPQQLNKWSADGGCGKIIEGIQLLQAGKTEVLKQAVLGAVKCGLDANSVDDINAAELLATACRAQSTVQTKIAEAVAGVSCVIGGSILSVANTLTNKTRPREVAGFPGVAAKVVQPAIGGSWSVLTGGCSSLKSGSGDWMPVCRTCVDFFEESPGLKVDGRSGPSVYPPCVFQASESRNVPGTVVGQCTVRAPGGIVVIGDDAPYPGTSGSTSDFFKASGASNVVTSCAAAEKLVISKNGRSCDSIQIDSMNNTYVWADFILPKSRHNTQIKYLDGGAWKGWGLRCYSIFWKNQSWTCNDGNWKRDGIQSKSYGAFCQGQKNDDQENLSVWYGERPNFDAINDVDPITFDASYYASKYPDLCLAFGADSGALLNHYMTYGRHELRQASPVFDPRYYLDHNPDVVKVYGYTGPAAKNHWNNNGRSEGRRGSADFDPTYYMNNNPDVRAVFPGPVGAMRHWLDAGIREGRRGAADVDYAGDPPRCGHLPAFRNWPAN